MLFGSHSENHFNLSKMNNDMIVNELIKVKKKIEKITKKVCNYILLFLLDLKMIIMINY